MEKQMNSLVIYQCSEVRRVFLDRIHPVLFIAEELFRHFFDQLQLHTLHFYQRAALALRWSLGGICPRLI